MAFNKTNIVVGNNDEQIDHAAAMSGESALFAPFEMTTPPQPQVASVTDDAGDIQGNLAPGGVTDDRQPDFHGQGTPGDTILIKDNGILIGMVEVGQDGQWRFKPSIDLGPNGHVITVVARDAAGNESQPSAPFNFVIDTTPPDASKLAIKGVADDVGGIVGDLASGATTDDARPVISGNGTAGNTIIVTVKDASGSRMLQQTTVGADGKWTLQVDTPLASGRNEFTAVEQDAAGNHTMPTRPYNLADGKHDITATATNPVGQTSDATGIWNFSIDTKAPGQVAGLEVVDDVGVVQGPLKNGDTTDDVNPEFKGKAEPGATVNLYDGDTLIGTGVADENGNWSITPTNPLGDGNHSLTTEVVDPAGNSSGKGPALNIAVDTTDVTVSISKLVDDQGAVKGTIVAGGSTDDERPEIQGQGKADSTIKVYDNGTLLGEALVKGDGTWSFTPPADLGEGAHAITATTGRCRRA